MTVPILYTQAQLSTVLAGATASMAQTVYNVIKNDMYYKDPSRTSANEAFRIQLYIRALSAWTQNADGTVNPTVNNPYSQAAFAAMVGYLCSHCGQLLSSGAPTMTTAVATAPVVATVPVVAVNSTTYYGGDASTYTLANLQTVAYTSAFSTQKITYNTAPGQYLWLLYPATYGTLYSITDPQNAQLISGFTSMGTVLIAGVTYNTWRNNNPLGTLSSYTLTFGYQ